MKRTLSLLWLLASWTVLAVVIGGTWFAAGAWRADPWLSWIGGVILGTCFIVCVCGVRGVYREETSDE